VFDGNAMLLIAPVAIILVAENLGHIKAVSAMTGRNLDPLHGPRLRRRRHRHHGLGRQSAAPASPPMPRTSA
jgi:xanthine/uracil permease